MEIRSERGAVLIFVALAIFALTAFTAIVADHGFLMAAKAAAQTSADAGALSGARSLALSQGNVHANGAAHALAEANLIVDAAPVPAGVVVTVPLACPPPFNVPPNTACIKVDVERQNLPTFFAKMVGLNTQGVRATATAMAGAGNSTSCLRPWFIPDGWQELSVPANKTFDNGVDVYRLPTPGPGTGYTTAQVGTVVTLAAGDPKDALAPGTYYQSNLDGNGGGTSEYRHNITNCSGVYKEINTGTACPLGDADPKCMNILPGRRPIPSAQATQDLIDADPYATVNAQGEIINSCSPSCPGYEGLPQSPRVVPVALFNPQHYYDTPDKNQGNFTLPIINIMGFFVQSAVTSGKNAGELTGVLVKDSSLSLGGTGVAGPANFLMTTILVR